MLLAVCLTASMAACSQGSTPSQPVPAGQKASTDPAAPAEEKVELEFMSWANEQEIQGMNPMIEAFEKAYPNVTIKWTSVPDGYEDKLKTRLISGDVPDIINASTAAYFRMLASSDFVAPLDDFIAADSNFNINNYPEKLLSAFQVGGKTYALPKDNCPIVLYYNKDIFDAAGVAYPSDTWKWEDLRTAAKALTKDTSGSGNTDQFGFSCRTDALVFDPTLMNGYGAPGLCNFNAGDKVTLTDPRNVEAFKFLQNIYVVDQSAPSLAAQVNEIELFTSGKLGMLIGVSFYIPNIKGANMNFGIAEVPLGIDGKRSESLFTSGFAIYSKAENKELCWQAISFMSYGEGNKILGSTGFGFPATSPAQYSDVFLTPDLAEKGGDAFVRAMDYQKAWNWGNNETEISSAYQTMIDTILTTKEDPTKILEAGLENIQRIYDKK